MIPELTVNNLISVARSWIGTPFHHQGRLPGVGMDCSGLFICLAEHFSIPHEDVKGYSEKPDGKLAARFAEWLDRVPRHKVESGDIIAFWLNRKKQPSHLALVTRVEDGRVVNILHADMNARKLCEHGMRENWHKHILAVFRIPGIEKGGE